LRGAIVAFDNDRANPLSDATPPLATRIWTPMSTPAAARESSPVGESQASPSEHASPRAAAAAKRKKGGARRAIFLLVALAIGAGVGSYAWKHRFLESTDDAQLDADVVPIAARIGGAVVAIHFVDNQPVKAGDLLVEIDPAPAKARLAQAEAELLAAKATADAADATAALTETNARGGKKVAEASLQGATVSVVVTSDSIAEARAQAAAAKANLDKAKADLDRTKALVAAGSLPSSQLESSQAAYDSADASFSQANARVATMQASTSQAQTKVTEASARLALADTIEAQIKESQAKAAVARARVSTAEATRDLAALELAYTRVLAPRAGIVSKRSIAPGQTIAAGQTVLMIVPTDAVWVTANFKETQLVHMRAGQLVHVTIDAYGGRELHGVVDSFSGATGARFALMPPDNASGNYTKVVQRVPVRVKLVEPPKDVLLLPGLSVEITVDTRP
jgi:membrane fusion protein (multidrug efflux system)